MKPVILLSLLISFSATAAVDKKQNVISSKKRVAIKSSQNSKKIISEELTLMALRLPPENRTEALKKQGPATLENLKNISSNTKHSLNDRWKALTSYGEIMGDQAEPHVSIFLKSKEWFMRSAALHALQFGKRETALNASAQLLNDPALMVRSSAVAVIDQLNGSELVNLMWEKLYSANNFYRGRSLWIRKSILEFLVKNAQDKDEPRFLRILQQEDESLHPLANKAIAKLK